MKITIAKSAGFCFGVKRAIDIALESAARSKDRVYMLGDIVHNENVVKNIERAGIEKTRKLNNPRIGSLLIRAHGSSKKIIEKAGRLGLKIIDATCPMVKEIHNIAIDMDSRGYKIIVIGDYKHDEVQGIVGQIKHKAIVLQGLADIKKKVPKRMQKSAVVVQSTQNLEKVLKMQELLKERVDDLQFFNTICSPTRLKQAEIKTLPKASDCIIVIGSKTSANTKRLYQIAKSINKNSYWINSPDELKKKWLRGAKSVGITAGASTPDETIAAIKERIQEIAH
ncbi:MAG: 4-hydroxy-3-methylbut-2-enyl diphosphate reductase [Omnitrophica WOR_2 bacterium RIFCSPHIGHO2_02_FULL_45_21]|nr:MAG: 4-hydroxy-3-methylbut-2-enyl diphosphate reductase [Omnitrophica WOR_2 bacterium RIFCSPHIGHO2_02_FULL_45_21]